jgi:hypothetical protein
MRNISSMGANFSPSSQNRTLRFGRALLPSSGIVVRTKYVVMNAADISRTGCYLSRDVQKAHQKKK